MKIAMSFVIVVMSVVSVYAQGGGRIELWADQAKTTCEIAESPSGLTEVHLFHMGNISTGGVHYFVVGIPECWTGATWVGDELAPGFTSVGDTQNEYWGISIGYGECRDLPVYLGKIVFATTGQSQPCCSIEAKTASEMQGPATLECTSPAVMWLVDTREAIINATSACPCAVELPVGQATWGAIKAMY